ncbi:alpha amylase, catalytic domain protein, partial [Cooperia oncophora]
VPYTAADFNDFRCNHNVLNEDYQRSVEGVRNCRLEALTDLNQGRPEVRSKLVAFLNKMIDYGVAGFRFDASKHMWPADLELILGATKNLRADIFGPNQRPFIVHEVTDQGDEAVSVGQYVTLGRFTYKHKGRGLKRDTRPPPGHYRYGKNNHLSLRYSNFNFATSVSRIAKGQGDWSWLANMGNGYGYGNLEDHDVVNFIDNHDVQRDVTFHRGITYKNGDQYRLAVSFMLAWPYGYPKVMSGYYFDHRNQGPPSWGSAYGYAIRSPTLNPDNTCDARSGWKKGVAIVGKPYTKSDRERVCVYKKSFLSVHGKYWKIAAGTEGMQQLIHIIRGSFDTTLPPGEYCDQYGGSLHRGRCTGRTISVNRDGGKLLLV